MSKTNGHNGKPHIQKLTGIPFMKKEKRKDFSAPWHCNTCGERYYRRDRFEGWAPTLIGQKIMMMPVILRQCLVCSKKRKQEILNVFGGTNDAIRKAIQLSQKQE